MSFCVAMPGKKLNQQIIQSLDDIMGYDASVIIYYGIRIDSIGHELKKYIKHHNIGVLDKTDYDTLAKHRCYYIGFRLDTFDVCRSDDGFKEVPIQDEKMESTLNDLSEKFSIPRARLWMITEHSFFIHLNIDLHMNIDLHI